LAQRNPTMIFCLSCLPLPRRCRSRGVFFLFAQPPCPACSQIPQTGNRHHPGGQPQQRPGKPRGCAHRFSYGARPPCIGLFHFANTPSRATHLLRFTFLTSGMMIPACIAPDNKSTENLLFPKGQPEQFARKRSAANHPCVSECFGSVGKISCFWWSGG